MSKVRMHGTSALLLLGLQAGGRALLFAPTGSQFLSLGSMNTSAYMMHAVLLCRS
jgi:hypothetical protein